MLTKKNAYVIIKLQSRINAILKQEKGELYMLNANKLKGKMVEKNISVALIAKTLGISPSTFYRKIKKNSFEIAEADAIVKTLGLTSNEAKEIFFKQFVA